MNSDASINHRILSVSVLFFQLYELFVLTSYQNSVICGFIQFYIYLSHKMGIIISVIVIAVSIANYIAGNIVDDLKDQIQAIVKTHKNDVDTVNKLKALVQKLDAKALKDAMIKMSASSTNNMKTILNDQASKINLLKSISVNDEKAEDYDTTLSSIINVVGFVMNMVFAMDMMLAPETGPIGWAVFAALTAILSTILSIFSLIGNIQQIGQLTDKNNKLHEYFKPGGDFETIQKNLRELSLQVVEDFHMFVITFRSMLNENYTLITMLSLDETYKNYDYSSILTQLEQSPFTKEFEDSTGLLVQDMREADKEQDMSRKLQLFVKKLDDFESNSNIDDKLSKAQSIVSLFDQKNLLSINISQEIQKMKGITKVIDRVTEKFKERETLDLQDKIDQDISIAASIDDLTIENIPNRNFQMALVVAFFTDTFYWKGKNEQTFLGFDLKKLHQRATLLNCIGSSADSANHVLLPEPPLESSEYTRWKTDRDRLIASCLAETADKQKVPIDQLKKDAKFQNMYLKLENFSFNYKDSAQKDIPYNRLVLKKGVVVICQVKNQPMVKIYDEYLEDGHFEHFQTTSQLDIHKDQEKVQTFHYSGKNLQQVAQFSCSYVNGGVSLQKLKEISIIQEGKQFKLTVQSSSIPQSQHKFNFLDCFVAKGKEEVSKKDFYLKKLQSENKVVNWVAELGESLVFWLIS